MPNSLSPFHPRIQLFLTTIDSSLVPEFYQLLQVNESKDTDVIPFPLIFTCFPLENYRRLRTAKLFLATVLPFPYRFRPEQNPGVGKER